MMDEAFLAKVALASIAFIVLSWVAIKAPGNKARYQAEKRAYNAKLIGVTSDGTHLTRETVDGHLMIKSYKKTPGIFGDSVSVSFAHHPECKNPSHAN